MSLRVLERPGHAEFEALSALCEQYLQAVEELLWNGVRSSANLPSDPRELHTLADVSEWVHTAKP